MSRIDELIAELRPKGVLFEELRNVAAYSSTRVDASALDETTFVGVDNLLPNMGGKTNATYTANTARLTAYEIGDILLGNIRPYLKKIWLASNRGGCSGDVLAIRIAEAHRPALMPEFLYRLLASEAFFAYNMQHAKGAKMPRGSKEAILKYRIPIPPLEVQREIVKVLDTFTQLEAELEARRRQYQYYRDALLTFGTDTSTVMPRAVAASMAREMDSATTGARAPFAQNDMPVRWATLGEIAINLDSQRRPVTKSARTTGNIPYYGASGIVDYVSDYIFDGDYLLVSEDGANLLARSTPIAFSVSGKTWVNNHAHVLQFNTYAERRFAEIYLNSIDLSTYVSGAAQPKLNQANLNRIPIPAPPLEEQQRIVAILDKFDALVNDLASGLPAEIKARHQQYAHYRDRLLTFKEAA